MKPPKKNEALTPIVEAFKVGLDNFVRSNSPDHEKLRIAAPAAFPIFSLTLEELTKGKLNTNPVAWRLLFGGPAAPATVAPTLADVAITGRHKTPKLVRFSQLAQVAEFFQHFEKILKAEQLIVAKMGFQLALLRIPGLTVEAFWLQSPAGGNDVVVPIRGPANLERRQYTVEEFVRTLQPLVKKFRAFDDKEMI